MYLLTPNGVKEKAVITERFLRFKLQEYEALEAEISDLRSEAKMLNTTNINNNQMSHP